MLRALGSVVLLTLLTVCAWAQIKVRLELPSSGSYQAWVGSKPPQDKLPETASLQGPSAEFTPGSFGPSDRLFILDETTGNLASKPMSEVKDGLKLAATDFSKLGKVVVRVEHAGKPVEAASVALKSGGDARIQLIDSASQGETAFIAVPPGPLQVTVQYKTSDGTTPDPIKQTVESKLERSKPDVVIVVSIPDEVTTLAPASPAGATKAGETAEELKERGGMGILGRLISFVLALAVAAALVFFGLKWMKSNQDQVQDRLTKLGVEIPGQNPEPPGDVYTPPAPIAPAPPQKIILDDAAPDPVSAPLPASAPIGVTAIANDPRLVSEDGSQIPLDEGTLSVGRDAGMGLSLLDESTVSRQHAEIVRSGNSVLLRDLGSTNGTYVNGRKVDGEVQLQPGDRVQFGAVKFQFQG